MKKKNPDSIAKFAKLFKNKEKADVWFISGDIKIPAHKFLLAASSDVFDRMFYGEFDPVEEIPICEPIASFTEFLQLFYLDEVDITRENIQSVAILVDKYHVKNCMRLCEELIQELVTNKTICSFLDTALMIEISTRTIEYLESLISKKTKEVLNTDGFKECSRDTLKTILSLNEIDCDEVTVFESVMEWASFECKRQGIVDDILNRKTVLGDIFYLIRFPVMKMKQFLDSIEPYPTIMQLAECLDIIQYISNKRPLTTSAKFSTRPREKSVTASQQPSLFSCNKAIFGNSVFGSTTFETPFVSTNGPNIFGATAATPSSAETFSFRSGI